MSCHESLVREFLENWVMFGQNTNKEEHKVFIRACKPGCRGADHHEVSSVGQLVVMPGAGLGTEEGRAVTVGINIMTHASTRLLWVTITFTSIMHSTILQRIFSCSKTLYLLF